MNDSDLFHADAVRECLERMVELRERVAALEEERERLAGGCIGAIRYGDDKVSSSPSDDALCSIVSMMCRVTQELGTAKAEFDGIRVPAWRAALSLDDVGFRIVSLRWFQGSPGQPRWGDIRAIVRGENGEVYSEAYIHRLHRRALSQMWYSMPEEFRILSVPDAVQ